MALSRQKCLENEYSISSLPQNVNCLYKELTIWFVKQIPADYRQACFDKIGGAVQKVLLNSPEPVNIVFPLSPAPILDRKRQIEQQAE